ncbi:MAG: hypothetical protein CMM69_08380 [Rhodospirillaceae bacterium]|nr:hypothetical protein [Rhodospirillaceae bacterium]OUX27422.1 MAG: hypothetical protein CBE16_08920 [Rhodospirillaceae bacterium TMED256]
MMGNFPNDDAAAKLLFLVLNRPEKEWSMPPGREGRSCRHANWAGRACVRETSAVCLEPARASGFISRYSRQHRDISDRDRPS